MTGEGLLARQDALQEEADAVHRNLGLDRLGELGKPVRVGSAALGVMVRRDLDITVICPALDKETADAVARLGTHLIGHPRVRVVTLRDDTGHWNTDPAYPDGLYLGVKYRSPEGKDWNLDIWFVDEPARQPDLAHLETFPQRLTDETRKIVLAIKNAWADNAGYGSEVTGYDVYTAVLDHGVRSLRQFEEWRRARR
ncbi:hypothetical protein FNH05_04715 [Amycolatopsis rhizosphaerae]|uniref:Nucleotidyltransferase family protein n=1 Tax=Amycolatopsis rhizosphaerae TaxID=2053003 RepID=A0A558DGS7_9PSEU|nr:hypothetical protein [Amycolatopsis rhizosphaerae]TVT60212.1 hypothetical protein FNH05_04715 [Amycolatopsis rhizosphaerae]